MRTRVCSQKNPEDTENLFIEQRHKVPQLRLPMGDSNNQRKER